MRLCRISGFGTFCLSSAYVSIKTYSAGAHRSGYLLGFFPEWESLKIISPPHTQIEMRIEVPPYMYEGMLISYRLRPLFGIPLKWIAEISTVREKSLFIDEQRRGPFRLWHHEHHFREVEDGVEIRDLLCYELPLGFLGRIMHPFVRRRLDEIFDYRQKALRRIFAKD